MNAEPLDPVLLSRLRRAVSRAAGRPMVARVSTSPAASGFAALANVAAIAWRGPLTPDHVIRTKRTPVTIGDDPAADVGQFAREYCAYFERCTDGSRTILDAAPRWGVWLRRGTVAFGATPRQAAVVGDIVEHTVVAIQRTEALGGWEADIFDVEYWELEQAKLGKGSSQAYDGRVVLVTGAAGAIGRAVAAQFAARGAAVVSVDVKEAGYNTSDSFAHIVCDLTAPGAAAAVVQETIGLFGGLDILVSSAGIFPKSARIANITDVERSRTLDVNLTSHQRLMSAYIPYLREGIQPAIIIVGSKNVSAPGPGQAPYSVSKAGLTQLARVAALELAGDGS